jgi:putative oxidoreductase
MFRKLIATDNDIATTILRLVLGVIFFAHGAQKMLGWFGGYGFTGTMGFFTHQLHIPTIFAFLAIVAEFAGSIALLAGFCTRLAAFGIAVNMVVAVAMVHGPERGLDLGPDTRLLRAGRGRRRRADRVRAAPP